MTRVDLVRWPNAGAWECRWSVDVYATGPDGVLYVHRTMFHDDSVARSMIDKCLEEGTELIKKIRKKESGGEPLRQPKE